MGKLRKSLGDQILISPTVTLLKEVVDEVVVKYDLESPLNIAFLSTVVLPCCDLAFVPFVQDALQKLSDMLSLSGAVAHQDALIPAKHRNTTAVLGCLAEKLAGKLS